MGGNSFYNKKIKGIKVHPCLQLLGKAVHKKGSRKAKYRLYAKISIVCVIFLPMHSCQILHNVKDCRECQEEIKKGIFLKNEKEISPFIGLELQPQG